MSNVAINKTKYRCTTCLFLLALKINNDRGEKLCYTNNTKKEKLSEIIEYLNRVLKEF